MESRLLQKIIWVAGKRQMELRAIKDIGMALESSRRVSEKYGVSSETAINNKDIPTIVAAITIDIEQLVDRLKIESAGSDEARRIVGEMQKSINNTCGILTDFAEAAAIVAAIYDPETERIGEINCQKGLDSFYLGSDIAKTDPVRAACKRSDDLVYYKNGLAADRIVLGRANIEYVPIGEGTAVAKISKPVYPLIISYYSGLGSCNKIFVFR